MGFTDILYSGTATYGKIRAWISAIIVTLIGIIVIYIALLGKFKSKDEKDKYPQEKPQKLSNSVRALMIVGSLVIIGILWIYVYFTMKSKEFSAIYGGVGAIGDIANVFR